MKQISLDIVNPLLATSVSPVFARHETFHPRFGWLKKGFDAALLDSGIFLRDDAPVRLGVGKNMARSIRYWCNAFKVIDVFVGRRKNLYRVLRYVPMLVMMEFCNSQLSEKLQKMCQWMPESPTQF